MRDHSPKPGNSREQLMHYWWLIALAISTGIAGQTAIKLGVSRPDAPQAKANISSLLLLIVQSPLVLLGLALYGVGALAWIAVLSRLDLSYAYPFLALNFVLITLISYLMLGESIPTLRWFGIGVICIGILLIARSAV